MLVLSRKPNERIVFPSLGITIQVVDIKGGKVCIGIEAPREVRVLRKEVLRKVAGSADSEAKTPLNDLQADRTAGPEQRRGRS